MTFKVGVSEDLRRSDGLPCFNPAAFDELKANPGIEWNWLDPCEELTPDHCAAYDAFLIAMPRVTAASVARDDLRCKLIARNGVGYDTVDVASLAAKGVMTTNTPLSIRRPVAVAALTHIFAQTTRLVTKDRLVRDGRWNDRVDHMGVGLAGRTLAVIGAGGIGKELIGLARPLFARIIAVDPHVDPVEGAEMLPLHEALPQADIVVVSCLLNDETRHLMGAPEFALMKPTAFFINVARGPIHDEAALIDALNAGQIAGAGLDVTEVEPVQPDNPLLAMDNVMITGHALCWTDECFEDIARTALRSIVDVSLGRRPRHVVEP